MQFKILKGDFSHKKLFVFLSTFFAVQKRPIENDRLKLPVFAIFSGVKGSLGDDVIGLLALAAWTQFWCFC